MSVAAILLMWTCVVATTTGTGLYVASSAGDITAVKRILENKCTDVNEPYGERKWKPLHVAAKHGYFKIALLLLACDADPNVLTSDHKEHAHDLWTPLMLASREGHTKLVKLLLNVDAKLDLQTGKGFTALLLASDFNHIDAVKALLCMGADTDIKRNDGWTALMQASYYSFFDVLNELLSAGADTEIKLPSGQTAEDIAIGRENFIGIQIIQDYKTKKVCR